MIRLSVKIATNSVWLALRIKGLSKKKVERVVIKYKNNCLTFLTLFNFEIF